MERNGWGDFFFFFLAVFLEQGVRRRSVSSMSEAGGCNAGGLVERIQAGKLNLRHLSCNRNQNNKKMHYFLRYSPGGYSQGG
jgi:hypothetical protein